MGMITVKNGAKIRKGAGSSIREMSPDDPIYKMGWFVGEITLKNFSSKAREEIPEAVGNKKAPDDKSGHPDYYNSHPNFVKFSDGFWKEFKQTQRKSVKSSLIFHIPHASRMISNIYLDQFLLSYRELYDEHLRLVDRYADELFEPSGYPSVISPASRFLCDVERFADDEVEPMAKIGMGAIYCNTTDGRPLRRPLIKEERDHLLQMYHRENERRMKLNLEEAQRSNGFALIVDCHTFPSIPLPCDADQVTPRPDICIGTDEDQTSPEVIELVTGYFTGLGYSVSMNAPYAGTYIPGGF